MRKLVILLALCSLNSCNSQTKKEKIPENAIVKIIKKDTTVHKTHTMEYFNIKDYENLKKDPEFINSKYDRQYILNDKRIRIWFDGEIIKVEEKSKSDSFELHKTFYANSKSIKYIGTSFSNLEFGIWKEYNEGGKLIKETNHDLPYKFSVEDLRQKMLKEYNIDIMDSNKIFLISRYIDETKEKRPFYEVLLKEDYLNHNDNEFLIDGTTGEILLTGSGEEVDALNIKQLPIYNRYINGVSKEDNPSVLDSIFGKKNKK